MTPKVSIIIPVYNAGEYIEECLNSVFEQTFKEIEILCLDDCSSDDSAKKIRQMAECDSRLALICNEKNLGAGGTRNRGIMLAEGKYFFFLDADDFLAADAIEKLYRCAEEQRLQLCFCSHVTYSEKDGTIGKSSQTADFFLQKYQNKVFSWNDVQRFLYQNIFCVPWNRLYRTDFVKNSSIRFPGLSNSEDFFFGEAIVAIADRMGIADADKPLVYYRVGREGQVSSTVGQNPYCMLESVKLLYRFLKETHKWEGVARSYHTIVLDVLRFPLKNVEHQEQMIKQITAQEFPRMGMSGLRQDDFTGLGYYKEYREFLDGKLSYLDKYMISVTEDRKKLNEIKQFLKRHRGQKTALWGMGNKGQALLRELGDDGGGFDFCIDADPVKASQQVKERKIYKYGDVTQQLDYIAITNARYFEEIYFQCKEKEALCKVIDLDTFFRCDMTVEECMA